jgi:uncharacterized alkaline shock family protein YloU
VSEIPAGKIQAQDQAGESQLPATSMAPYSDQGPGQLVRRAAGAARTQGAPPGESGRGTLPSEPGLGGEATAYGNHAVGYGNHAAGSEVAGLGAQVMGSGAQPAARQQFGAQAPPFSGQGSADLARSGAPPAPAARAYAPPPPAGADALRPPGAEAPAPGAAEAFPPGAGRGRAFAEPYGPAGAPPAPDDAFAVLSTPASAVSQPGVAAVSQPGVAAGAQPVAVVKGRVEIEDEVVEKVAGLAAVEVAGVSDLGGDLARAFESVRQHAGVGQRRGTQGVRARIEDRQVWIHVVIVIEYGAVVMDVARAVKANVARAVSHMLGVRVVEVNVTVDDVAMPRPANAGARPGGPDAGTNGGPDAGTNGGPDTGEAIGAL